SSTRALEPGANTAPASHWPVGPIWPLGSSSHCLRPRCSMVIAAFVRLTRSFLNVRQKSCDPLPPAKWPVVSRIITVRGSALRGRRDRYWVAATSACGPLSSIALDPSLWEGRQTRSALEPAVDEAVKFPG